MNKCRNMLRCCVCLFSLFPDDQAEPRKFFFPLKLHKKVPKFAVLDFAHVTVPRRRTAPCAAVASALSTVSSGSRTLYFQCFQSQHKAVLAVTPPRSARRLFLLFTK